MKTIEEAAKEQSANEVRNGEDNDALFCNRFGMKQIIERSFKSGVKFAQRWIPVEEELPESDEILTTVIVKIHGKKIDAFLGYQIANYDKRDKQFHYRGMLKTFEKVTHWRPIELK